MTDPSAIDVLLARARGGLTRVRAEDLADEMARGAAVIDFRPVDQRQRDGDLPGAIVVDRNVLEWRLDPTSPHRLTVADLEARVIIVCNEGFSSSLAAATLQELGLRRATDLVGGYRGWLAGPATKRSLSRRLELTDQSAGRAVATTSPEGGSKRPDRRRSSY